MYAIQQSNEKANELTLGEYRLGLYMESNLMELNEAKEILKNAGFYLIESTDNYREIVTKKLAQIYDRCYDSDDAGRSYAEKHVAEFEPQIAEVLEEGGDAPISPYEVAEVIWYILHHSQLQGTSILSVYMRYTRNEPDFFKTWY